MIVHYIINNWIGLVIVAILLLIMIYFYLFYPQQLLPPGKSVEIQTPEPQKYMNDCLHPCVRFIPEGFMGYKWWMVQSPYYARNNKLENPILYFSKDEEFPSNWECIGVVYDTPQTGYNSDPTLFCENNKLWIFWRECGTPVCNELGVLRATVGFSTNDCKHFSPLQVYLTDKNPDKDTEQCPVLIKRDDKYLFYATHYQYKPVRKNIGLAIWEGTSLENPDFKLKGMPTFKSVYTCDAWKQLITKKQYWFIPMPLKYDLWHFDLFEYNNRLYMFSSSEWGDNIMLSVSDDYENFKTYRKPLINTHYTESIERHWKYYYKPTGYIADDVLNLYYTGTGEREPNRNILYSAKAKLKFN
ncbi:MAG: hypothetical protein PHR83_09355 [Paludibacter sp.]|nr:hypothetical protein [Paludibacter sp.]